MYNCFCVSRERIWENGETVLFNLHFSSRLKRFISFKPRLLYPRYPLHRRLI